MVCRFHAAPFKVLWWSPHPFALSRVEGLRRTPGGGVAHGNRTMNDAACDLPEMPQLSSCGAGPGQPHLRLPLNLQPHRPQAAGLLRDLDALRSADPRSSPAVRRPYEKLTLPLGDGPK